jgi:hypothetical protein
MKIRLNQIYIKVFFKQTGQINHKTDYLRQINKILEYFHLNETKFINKELNELLFGKFSGALIAVISKADQALQKR